MSDAPWATPKALLELWRSLAVADDSPAAIPEVLAERLVAMLGDGIAIDLLGDDGAVYRAAARGVQADERPGPVEEVVRSGCAKLIPCAGLDAPSRIIVPLPGPDGVLGALSATRRAPGYGEADLEAVREIAACGALALARARSRARAAEDLEALRASQAWLRDLVESSPAVIFLKDLEGRYVAVNKRCEENMRRGREEVLGKTGFDFLPQHLAESFHRIDRQVIESGDVVESEDKFMMGGGWHVFQAVKFPVRDPEGRIRGTGGMATEITNQVRAMEVLERGREQLSFITDALPALVCYLDTAQRYQFLNMTHEEWFRTARSQFYGRTLRDVVGEQAYATMLPYVTRTLEGESCTFETAIGAAGAPARQTRVTLSPHRNFSGEVEGFVALVTDVTEHKASAGRSRLLADASKALSSSFDYQTTLRRVAELVVPGLADWCKIEIAAPGEHGAPCVVEHPVPEAGVAGLGLGDHAPDPLSTFTAAVMIHEEKVGGITLARSSAGPRFEAPDLAVIEELARRIALAVENAHLYNEAQRAIRLRDEFMSIASHELRTPLTSLSLDLEVVMRLLERQGSEGRIMQRANKLSSHLGRLKQLVLTLLDVSQIEAGRLVIAAEALDLRIVVGEVIDRFTEQAALSQCELHPELPPEPVEGAWDRLRIDQVLTNLLSNAIRYAPGRPIDVKLVAAPTAVTLTVRDHGPGIRPEDRERIFGRFERAASGRGIGGFGLGLWITRQIIIALGGTVRVESVPNVETSFIIELPRRT